MTPRALGMASALVALASDQASKQYLLQSVDLGNHGPIALAPFAELRLVWNYGISYGFLRQMEAAGQWLLIGAGLAAAIALTLWLWRQQRRLPALAIGLIIGGAIGNVIDRAFYGAVVDFMHLFMPDRSLSWYVFNLADIWIVAGVVGLLYDSLFGPKDATNSVS